MWWEYVVIVAVLALGVYGFVAWARFMTWNLSRRTDRRPEDLYDRYGDQGPK